MILEDDISKYAAALLCKGFYDNAESALYEAKLYFQGRVSLVCGDWEDFYLVQYEDTNAYMAKHIRNDYRKKRLKW